MKYLSVLILIISFVLSGCAAAELPPTSTQAPDPHFLSAQPIEVFFDGDVCTASGPASLPLGEHSFILYNTSDLDVKVEVAHFHPGKSIQDLLDRQEKPGVWWPKPDWLEHASPKGSSWSRDDGGKVWTYKTYMEADYVFYVIIFDYDNDPFENRLWFCQQFTVTESANE